MLPPPVRYSRTTTITLDHASGGSPPCTPGDLGLPEKFTAWRNLQWDAIERIMDSPKRFVVICASTGFGKTLAYAAAAVMTGRRTVILTATKGLQDQISGDFVGLSSDIRGLNNYLCPITRRLGIPDYTSVADAPCQCGYPCALKRGGCPYFDFYRAAQRADIVVTNYACWLADGSKPESDRGDLQYGVVPDDRDTEARVMARDRQGVKMLICDEAHDCSNMLSMSLGVDMSRHECLTAKLSWPDAGLGVDDWQGWAAEWLPRIAGRVTAEEDKVKSSGGRSWSRELKSLRDIKRKLERLAGMKGEDGWIANEQDTVGKSMSGIRFDPLSPARYAEDALWRGISKIVLVSATVRPKTAELLGIPADQLEFVEYESSFAPARRPVIHVPTGVRMTYHTERDDETMKWWLRKLDDVIEPRLHRKGLIHAVSYKRSAFIRDNSKFGEHMMIHNSHDRARVVEAFKRANPPCILVSPSLGTGYDFAGDLCRWQAIVKLPFSSVTDKLVKARQELDKEYGLYLMAQDLIQCCGRPVRSESDWAESLILDDSFLWAYWKARRFMPRWFQEAVVWADGIPEPISFDDPLVPQPVVVDSPATTKLFP